MAQAGRSPIQKSLMFRYEMPEDMKYKRFNMIVRNDDLGQHVVEVGFRGKTGKQWKVRGQLMDNYEIAEEYFAVADPVHDKFGKQIGYEGGGVEEAKRVTEELLIPRLRELFADSEDVYPTIPEDADIEDGMLAPSVDPIPASGVVAPTVKGKKVQVK